VPSRAPILYVEKQFPRIDPDARLAAARPARLRAVAGVAAVPGLAGLRAGLYRAGVLKAGRLPVPVIVVGNIFIGGTGKTPLTIWLAQALRAAGCAGRDLARPRRRRQAPRAVTPESNTPRSATSRS
jgi:hypothetical protein